MLGVAREATLRKQLECPECGEDVDLSEQGEETYLECVSEECDTEVQIG